MASDLPKKDEQSRWKLRNANVSSIFGAEKIYIYKNLTARRTGLFKKVRDQKRLHQEWKIWTVDGNIFVKPGPSSRTSKINSLDNLNSLYGLQYISISLQTFNNFTQSHNIVIPYTAVQHFFALQTFKPLAISLND